MAVDPFVHALIAEMLLPWQFHAMKSTANSAGRDATAFKLQKRGKCVVAVSRKPLPKLTAEKVRETVERIPR